MASLSKLILPGLIAVAAIALTVPLQHPAAPETRAGAADRPGQASPAFPFVLTQVPAGRVDERASPAAEGGPGFDCGDGARIVVVRPGPKTRPLTAGFASACDPDVSFDGTRIVFAGKKKPTDRWHIFEMDVDGTNVRQITRNLGNCRHPVYLSTLYTIVSDKPWYTIAFVSDAAGEALPGSGLPVLNLYTTKLDGTAVRRITFNPLGVDDPFLLQDGRLLFTSGRPGSPDGGSTGRYTLHGVNIDGTDDAAFTGDQGRRLLRMPGATTSGLVLFVESDTPTWDGAGDLASVRLRRNLHSYRTITPAGNGLYHSPSPLPDGDVLVSRRPVDGTGTHAVYRLDPESGRMEKLFDAPDYHDIQARALRKRPEPDGRSSVVNEQDPTGRLYCLNTYIGDPPDPQWVPPGTVRRLRVIEGLPPAGGTVLGVGVGVASSTGNPRPVLGKRLLGDVPVEEDGSFNIQVPANIPIQLQLLDADGLALRTCGWIWVKNKEPRGCIGCHEDGERTPPNVFVEAVAKPSIPLTLPPEKRRTVDYRHDVGPIIESRCASMQCHGGGLQVMLSAPVTDDRADEVRSNAFHNLLALHDTAPGTGRTRRYVVPGEARTSPFIWQVLGRVTARPWDESYGSRPKLHMPPPGLPALSGDEERTLVEWVDLGAPWDGSPAGRDEGGRPHVVKGP